jgi:polyferredoxin
MRSLLIILTLAACVSLAGAASENFPPPEFETGYYFPNLSTPGARAQLYSIIDIIVLVGVMLFGAWLTLRRRSRRHIVVLVIFSLLYFGFYRRGCICAIGAIGNIAQAIGDPDYVLPLVAGAFFVLPLLAALFFGRVFCGVACPLGMIQDLVILRPLRVPRPLAEALGLIPFVYLGAAVLFAWTGSGLIICRYDPYVAFFRLGGSEPLLIAGAVMLLIGMFIARPYCRFICPYSVLLRACAAIAKSPPRITTGECITCHLCADTCPFDAIRPPTPDTGGPARREGKSLLIALIVLLPILMALGGYLGYKSSHMLSRAHYEIRLAERLWAEEQGTVEGTTEPTDAFYYQGQANEGLYGRAAEIRRKFDLGSTVLGAWLGLVIAGKLISLTVRRRRTIYEIDPTACFACGRCYEVCPVDRAEAAAAETVPTGSS